MNGALTTSLSGAEIWWLIVACVALTAAIKALGPVALGGRTLPGWFMDVLGVMAAALLSALVLTSTLADGQRLAVGANTVGVALAGLLLWRGRSLLLAVAVAVLVTAGLRALTG